MAAFDYGRIAAVADRLLERFGRAATLTAASSGAYNPATSAAAESTTAAQVRAADFDYETVHGGRAFEPGSLIQVGDRMVIMSGVTTAGVPLAADPDAGDRVTLGAEVWGVVRLAQKIAPAGTVALYILQVRR